MLSFITGFINETGIDPFFIDEIATDTDASYILMDFIRDSILTHTGDYYKTIDPFLFSSLNNYVVNLKKTDNETPISFFKIENGSPGLYVIDFNRYDYFVEVYNTEHKRGIRLASGAPTGFISCYLFDSYEYDKDGNLSLKAINPPVETKFHKELVKTPYFCNLVYEFIENDHLLKKPKEPDKFN